MVEDDKIIKHLEFIQNTINRMSTNSFIIKGWAITLVGLIIGLNKPSGHYLFYSAKYNFPIETVAILLIVVLFWLTNAYFLQQERRYIYIYSKTIEYFKSNNPNMPLILDMNYSHYLSNSTNVRSSNTCILFWTIIIICVAATGAFLAYCDDIFIEILIIVVLLLVIAFVFTYFIPVNRLCQYWTCLIGRTIISVYGVLVILILLTNHIMFNHMS